MSAPFRAAGVAVLLLGACTTPPPEAYVAPRWVPVGGLVASVGLLVAEAL